MVALFVEVTHTNLSEVTWMVLIHVGSVMMLTTSKTTTTRMLAVLSYTTFTGGNMTAATQRKILSASILSNPPTHHQQLRWGLIWARALNRIILSIEIAISRNGTYCLRVLLKWVGILSLKECRELSMSLVRLS